MEEFKLQFYFNLYKDKPFVNGVTFKKRFERMHGKFESINKLIIMIENYQINMVEYWMMDLKVYIKDQKG